MHHTAIRMVLAIITPWTDTVADASAIWLGLTSRTTASHDPGSQGIWAVIACRAFVLRIRLANAWIFTFPKDFDRGRRTSNGNICIELRMYRYITFQTRVVLLFMEVRFGVNSLSKTSDGCIYEWMAAKGPRMAPAPAMQTLAANSKSIA